MKEMKFTALLTSEIEKCIKIEESDGVMKRIPTKISNANNLLDNIKKYLKGKTRVVLITTLPNDFEANDEIGVRLFKSLNLSGLRFKEKIVLDYRNIKKAKEILAGADLIWLSGGKIIPRLKFLNKIHFKKILNNFDGVVIGVSAGSMNLCKNIYNFPEGAQDLGQKELIKGLDFYDEYFIPHSDGSYYLYEEDGYPVFKKHIYPFSFKRDLICVPNDSYVLLNEDGAKYYGDIYLLRKGEIYKKI